MKQFSSYNDLFKYLQYCSGCSNSNCITSITIGPDHAFSIKGARWDNNVFILDISSFESKDKYCLNINLLEEKYFFKDKEPLLKEDMYIYFYKKCPTCGSTANTNDVNLINGKFEKPYCIEDETIVFNYNNIEYTIRTDYMNNNIYIKKYIPHTYSKQFTMPYFNTQNMDKNKLVKKIDTLINFI